MRKFLSFAICGLLGLQVHAQYLNGGFDQAWVKDTKGNGALPGKYLRPGTQPVDWEASNVNQKVFIVKTEILVTSDTDRGGSATGKSAKMVNKFVGIPGIGSNAPAYITLGIPWVFAISDIPNCDGGTLGGIPFSHKPDAIKGFFKRTGSANDPAKIIVYAWKGTYTSTVKTNPNGGMTSNSTTKVADQDRCIWNDAGYDSKTEGAKLIAKCDYGITETLSDWTEIEVPLTYESNEAPEKINVVLSASNYWNRGAIENNGTLWADDVQFVYYSQLKTLKFDGHIVAGFNKDVYAYKVNQVYDANKVEIESDGVGASVTKTFDPATNVLTVTVEGNDIATNSSNKHVYTIEFAASTLDYTNSLSVSLGSALDTHQPAVIRLAKFNDGTYGLSLDNFALGGTMFVGDISLFNITPQESEGVISLSTEQNTTIMSGVLPGVAEEEWIGPMIGEVPINLAAQIKDEALVATINIPLVFLAVKVVFAPELVIDDAGAYPATASGLYNIILNRNFKQGWNTLCLPFTPALNELGVIATVNVQEYASYDDKGLNFSVVEPANILPNTPYLVHFDEDINGPIYLSGNVVAGEPIEVTHGDFTLKGTYEPMSMSGLYGVAKVGDVNKLIQGGANATINGTRAYFQSNTPNVKNVKVNFEGETVDAIGGVEADGATTYDVYTLSGVQVRKGAVSLNGLSKGVYIVNGKKMIIK